MASEQTLSPLWLPQHKNSIDPNFLQWFIGFSEGNGSFSFSCSANQLYYRHAFIINQKDPLVLYKIRTHLGFGTVKLCPGRDQGTSYWQYVVYDVAGIFRLIQIFYGQLILNKTQKRYATWCDTFFKRPQVRQKGFSLDLLESKRPCLLDNAWLSGFIDAEGCFSAVWKRSSCSSRPNSLLRLRFAIVVDQKNESLFLESLVSLFGSGYVQNRNECVDMQRFVLDLTLSINPSVRRIRVTKTSQGAYKRLFSYLKKFPLKSVKHVSFVRFHKIWIRLHDGIIRKNRSLERLERLVSSINVAPETGPHMPK